MTRRDIITVSGIDGSGKSSFGRRLRDECARSLGVVLLHVDDFRRHVDWGRPERSEADAYLEDYYDLDAIDACLDAFLAGAERAQRPRFDEERETIDGAIEIDLRGVSVVIVEGVFTLNLRPRPEPHFQVYLLTSFDEARRRIVERRVPPWRTLDDFEHRISTRYFPAQDLYLATHDPAASADVLIDNQDYRHPRLIRASLDRLGAELRAALTAILPPAGAGQG